MSIQSGPNYDRNRFPKAQAKGLCRGCGNPVPARRESWCSNACFERYDPARVRFACRQRDQGVCAECGVDTESLRRSVLPEPCGGGWSPALPNREERLAELAAQGWPNTARRRWWEMDHITPFSEGGLTVLENVRTLCVPCHKRRTKDWRLSL